MRENTDLKMQIAQIKSHGNTGSSGLMLGISPTL